MPNELNDDTDDYASLIRDLQLCKVEKYGHWPRKTKEFCYFPFHDKSFTREVKKG